jgi:hypothetical protein
MTDGVNRNMPGFTAENAIYKTSESYRMAGRAYQNDPKSALVGPALPRDPWSCVLSCFVVGGPLYYKCVTDCLDGGGGFL